MPLLWITTAVSNTKTVNVHDTLQHKKGKGRLEKQTFYHPGLMASDAVLLGFSRLSEEHNIFIFNGLRSPTRIMLFGPPTP
jgi:hypothetical protein